MEATSDEVDEAAVRRLLADVSRKAEQAQARVIATIAAKQVEFVAASERVSGLRGDVERLRGDVRKAVAATGTAVEHRATKERIETLDTCTFVLKTMLEVQRLFSELEACEGSANFPAAAERAVDVARALQGVSAPDAASDPSLVRAAKAEYYKRRSALAQRVEDALDTRLSFGEHSVSVQSSAPGTGSSMDLGQVWQALQTLGLLDRKVEQLAADLRSTIVSPLLEAARRLPSGQGAEAKVSEDRGSGTTMWMWAVDADVPPRRHTSEKGPPVAAVLPVLEALFIFVREHVTAGTTNICAALGRRLWQSISSSLLKHFDTCEFDGGVAIERFEVMMCSQGFISSKEKTLSRIVCARRNALGEKRRTQMLAEVRGWLLQENAALVKVSDAQEPGSVTQLLREMEATQDAAASGAQPVSEKLKQALRDDAGYLRIPVMQVSASVHKLGMRIRELVEEAVAAVGQGYLEGARDLNRLAREACALFSVLRPHVQKGQLKTSPQCCGLFFSDCLYLVHVLLLIPYNQGKSLLPEHKHLALFVDLVPQVRRLGESHFLAMLRHQQDRLAEVLRPCDLTGGISQDRRYIAAEAALGAAVQQVKEAAQGLLSVLPAQLFCEVVALLAGIVVQNLLNKLFQLQHLAPDEVSSVSSLLSSTLDRCKQIFSFVQACEGGRGEVDVVPGWDALLLVSELLGSGFSRFMERRAQLQLVLKKEEVLKLMHLSWRDEFLAPEEAWEALSNS